MNYVIAKIDGKQVKLAEGQVLKLNFQKDLNVEVVASFIDGNADFTPGKLNIELERLEDKKDKKVRVVRFKSKSRYRKTKGHKQPISIIRVKSLGTDTKETKAEKVEKAPKTEKSEKVTKTAKTAPKAKKANSTKKEATN